MGASSLDILLDVSGREMKSQHEAPSSPLVGESALLSKFFYYFPVYIRRYTVCGTPSRGRPGGGIDRVIALQKRAGNEWCQFFFLNAWVRVNPWQHYLTLPPILE